MKKYIVTGANGYLGLEVCRTLSEQGAQTLAVVRKAPSQELLSLTGIEILVEDVSNLLSSCFTGDLKDYILIDCAWENGFNHSWTGHSKVANDRASVLSELAEAGLGRIIGLGSMHEYGRTTGPVSETTLRKPVNEYGDAKLELSQRLGDLSKTFATSVLWVRCFYLYGSDERNKSLWTKILLAAKEGKKKFPLDAAKSKFDFLNVREAAKTIIDLANSTEDGQINLGSGSPVELRDFLIQFVELNKLDIELEFSNSDNGFEGIWPNIEKLRSILLRN